MPPSKDGWSRSLLDTPSPDPSDDEGGNDLSSFVPRDNDLLAELDLSRREDRAIVRETPFSLARLRAQARERQAANPTQYRGSIVTAEDAIKHGIQTPTAPPPPPAKKNDWRNNSGWTNAQGAPIPTSTTTATAVGKSIPTQGTTTQIIKKPLVVKRPAPEDFRPPKKAKGKPRAKKAAPAKAAPAKAAPASQDKITFGCLPANPSPDYPIIAALERQKALPTKPKQPRKAPAKPKAKPKKKAPDDAQPAQQSLDVHFLVTGGTKAQDVRKKAREELVQAGLPPVETFSNRSGNTNPSRNTKAGASGPSTAISQYLYQSTPSSSKAPIVIDDSPPPTSTGPTGHPAEACTPQSKKAANGFNTTREAEGSGLPSPPPSSSPLLVTPKPIPIVTVSQLEAMVEDGYDFSARVNVVTPSRSQALSQSQAKQYAQAQHTSYSPAIPGSDSVMYTPVARRASSPFMRRPMSSSSFPQRDFDSPIQPQYQYQQDESLLQGSYSGLPMQEVNNAFPSSSHRHSSQSSSQSRRPSYPSSSNSRWAALGKTPDSEWSTLPQRRTRLTIRPQASAVKSSSFRLPLNRLGSSRAGSSRETHQASSSPEGTTQAVTKVTLWAPPPPRQSSSQANAEAGPSQPRGYVPPAMRVLHQAGTTSSWAPIAEPPMEMEEDDWEAAWSRTANIALQ